MRRGPSSRTDDPQADQIGANRPMVADAGTARGQSRDFSPETLRESTPTRLSNASPGLESASPFGL
jgi:hypothetical protein